MLLSFGPGHFFLHFLSKNMMDTVNIIIFFRVLSRGCEMCLTSREEQRWRFFKTWVLRKIVGPKSEEIRGMWSKLPHEKLYDLYSSPCLLDYQIKGNEIGGVCSTCGLKEKCLQIFIWRGNRTRSLRIPSCRLPINSKFMFFFFTYVIVCRFQWLRSPSLVCLSVNLKVAPGWGYMYTHTHIHIYKRLYGRV